MTTKTLEGFMPDDKGRLVPEELVKPQQKLEDQAVRSIIEHACELSDQIARFKGHTFADVASFMDVLAEEYGAKKGGAKGNVTLKSYDGLRKVTVQVQDTLAFGPELQVRHEFDRDPQRDRNDDAGYREHRHRSSLSAIRETEERFSRAV